MKKKKQKYTYIGYKKGGYTKAQFGLGPDTNQTVDGKQISPAVNRYTKDKDGNLVDIFTGEIIYKVDPNQQGTETADALNTINKAEYTPTGQFTMPNWLRNTNAVIDTATGVANYVGEINKRKNEKKQYLNAIQPRAYFNPDEAGLNNIPSYFQSGGGVSRPIIAEAGEVYKDVNGLINKIPDSAPTHDSKSGGVVINDAHKVLEDTGDKRADFDSKALLIQPNELFDMFGISIKKPVTHSKAFELASKKSEKDTKYIEKYLKRNVKSIDNSPNDQYAKNSLEHNTKALEFIPTDNDIFQTLFGHQEMKKIQFDIDNNTKAQNGYDANAVNDVEAKRVLDYLDQQRRRTNSSYYQNEYNNYLRLVNDAILNDKPTPSYNSGNPLYGEDYFNSAGYRTNYPLGVTGTGRGINVPSVQSRRDNGLYGTQDWNMQDFYGRHPWVQQQNPSFNPANSNDVRWFQNEYNKRSEEYFGIPYFNGSAHRKVDGLFGQGTWSTPDVTPLPELLNQQAQQDTTSSSPTPSNSSRTLNFTSQPDNRFSAPLQWYDTAVPTYTFLDTLNREPVKFNPVNLTESQAKYLNPLPALQEGQRSYNTALASLPSNGSGNANAVSLFGRKYGLDTNTLGSYENQNNGIWTNNNILRTNTRNTQAQLDQQARDVFETRRLTSLEAQRQQLLRSMSDITTTIAQNAKYNREGNLLMKLFPAFNQRGNYNGYRYNFTSPSPQNTFQNQIQQLELMGVKLTPQQKLKFLNQSTGTTKK